MRSLAPPRALLAIAALAAASGATAATAIAAGAPPRLRAAAAPRHELDAQRRIVLPGGATIERFQQRVGGVPVIGAEAIVSDPGKGVPRLVADTTRSAIDAPAKPRVSRREAIAIARSSVGARDLRGPVSARLEIRPGGGGAVVWRVRVPAAHPAGDFEVLVDAIAGGVVARNELERRFETGRARLYRVNPVVQNRGARHLWRDGRDRDTPLLRRLRRRVRLPNLDDGQHCLVGRWVRALRGHNDKRTCKPNLQWSKVTRSNGRFEALMVYFQINRAQRYIQSLGFSGASSNGVADRVQRAVANAYRADSSAYFPLTQTITYGSGGVDDAEDGDVILHEYAHAMQDSQSPSFGDSARYDPVVLAEGSADYWAAAMSAHSPHTANEDDVCIFDWDATTYGRRYPRVPPERSGRRCGRRADVDRTVDEAKARCPHALFGSRFPPDPHCVGQVWSSALWDLRRALSSGDRAGGRRMDQIYLAAQFLYTGRETLKDAARALLCADEDLHPKGRPGDCRGGHYSLIRREMARRGILR